MKKIFITGASGFLGSYVTTLFSQSGWECYILSRKKYTPNLPNIYPLYYSIHDVDAIYAALEKHKIHSIAHLAAHIGDREKTNDCLLYETNCLGTVKMLQLATRLKVDSFIYASGLSIIGIPQEFPINEKHLVNPITAYHASKYAGEIACLEHGNRNNINTIALRITAPYGPAMGRSVFSIFVEAALQQKKISIYGTGSRIQNFIAAQDVARAFLLCAEKNVPSGVYNLGGEKSISMLELAHLICDVCEVPSSLISKEHILDPQEHFRFDVSSDYFKEKTNFSYSMSLREGCAQYCNFVKSKDKYGGWWLA